MYNCTNGECNDNLDEDKCEQESTCSALVKLRLCHEDSEAVAKNVKKDEVKRDLLNGREFVIVGDTTFKVEDVVYIRFID